MYKVFGFVNLHHSPSLGPLTETRSLASTSFLGRYAFIDFTLSNFTNSGVEEVGILVKNNMRSLIKHMGSGMSWNINTKLGSRVIMYNEAMANNPLYNNDVSNIAANDWMLMVSKADYIVVAPVHFIMSIDYRKVIDEHISSGAEISVVYHNMTSAKKMEDCDVVDVSSGCIKSIHKNECDKDCVNLSLETYVINRKRFRKLIQEAKEYSAIYSLRDIINYVAKSEPVHAYEHTGYVRVIDSLSSFQKVSLELLSHRVWNQLFHADWPIYTVTHDTMPARYLESSQVRNAYIANGSIVNGTVENSIISRNVVIGKGAVVKNSIILTDTLIGEGVVLDGVIVDKYAKIIHSKKLVAKDKDQPIFIRQGDVI